MTDTAPHTPPARNHFGEPLMTTDTDTLVARLRAAYTLVADFPESKPDGFMNLLALRNLTPEAAARIEALEAEVARLLALHESDVENCAKIAHQTIVANNERAILAAQLTDARAGEDELALYLAAALGAPGPSTIVDLVRINGTAALASHDKRKEGRS